MGKTKMKATYHSKCIQGPVKVEAASKKKNLVMTKRTEVKKRPNLPSSHIQDFMEAVPKKKK